jgi:hypothetical protein
MVFTDGDATDKAAVPAAAQKWRAKGVLVFSVGIGPYMDSGTARFVTILEGGGGAPEQTPGPP